MNVAAIEIKDSIKDGERLPIEEYVAEDTKNLITECWDDNPKLRPTFSEILTRLKEHAIMLKPSGNFKSVIQLPFETNDQSRNPESGNESIGKYRVR